jgi:hypothetical protein
MLVQIELTTDVLTKIDMHFCAPLVGNSLRVYGSEKY